MKISAHRTLFVFIKPWQYLNIWSFTERISKLSKTRLMWTDVLIQTWISRSSRWVGTVSLIGRLCARAAHCVVWGVWTHFCYYALCKTRHISTGSDRDASTSEREREREAPFTPWGYFLVTYSYFYLCILYFPLARLFLTPSVVQCWEIG